MGSWAAVKRERERGGGGVLGEIVLGKGKGRINEAKAMSHQAFCYCLVFQSTILTITLECLYDKTHHFKHFGYYSLASWSMIFKIL